MRLFQAIFLISVIYLVSGDKDSPIGPDLSSTTTKPTSSTATPTSTTTSTTTTTTTTTTPKPTTTSTTTTTTTTTTTPKSTTKPSTTTSTTAKPTTPKPVDPVGKWVVNYTNSDKTCLILEAALDIDLHYKEGNTTKNLTIHVPSTAIAEGLCESKVENITLTFTVPNSIRFIFKKSNDSKKYDLGSVIVMLNANVSNETRILTLTHSQEEFSTPVSNSYKCFKEQFLNLTSKTKENDYGGVLRISHFQVQAFRNASSTKFDEAVDCATSETPDVVPIAVGCALAALVVFVLIAYLIGRRRSQARGYLSMFAQNKREEDYIPMKNLSCFN